MTSKCFQDANSKTAETRPSSPKKTPSANQWIPVKQFMERLSDQHYQISAVLAFSRDASDGPV